jgi:hypothetical protein
MNPLATGYDSKRSSGAGFAGTGFRLFWIGGILLTLYADLNLAPVEFAAVPGLGMLQRCLSSSRSPTTSSFALRRRLG